MAAKRLCYCLCIICFVIFFCNCNPLSQQSSPHAPNQFSDPVLITIYNYQDQRNTSQLIPFFHHKNPAYRYASALAFGSIQDTNAILPLTGLLSDTSADVRFAATYSLGQTRHPTAEKHLINAFKKEKFSDVKHHILEALGKCGSPDGLNFITQLNYLISDTFEITGQAWGIYRFALRQMVNTAGSEKMASFLGYFKTAEDLRFVASAYFARASFLQFDSFYDAFQKSEQNDSNGFVRMNIATALSRCKNPEKEKILAYILRNDADYRVLVNTIRGLERCPYEIGKKIIYEKLFHGNPNVQAVASTYFRNNGSAEDALLYLATCNRNISVFAKGNLYAASLKFAPDSATTDSINKIIIARYHTSSSNYEKAFLLSALSEFIPNHAFIANECFNSKNAPVIKSYGMDALIAIRANKNFSNSLSKEDQNQFAEYFRKAIISGDVALAALAAGVLRDELYDYRKKFSETTFIKNAQSSLKLPRDIETYNELQQTIDFLEGKKVVKQNPAVFNHPINWDFVKTIPSDQTVTLITNKGNIKIRLMVNEAPGSVANFLELVENNFYKRSPIHPDSLGNEISGTIFHRVVPNFVVQAGCPRGDGWGGSEQTIRSEFFPAHYSEGFLGMASAGKDTEGSQWFITHSPTTHLDGNYTIFGKVIEGMEVVNTLEIGDVVVKFFW